MRPVVKGPWPKDKNGDNTEYTDYSNARRDLIARIGECCSYCEVHLDSSLAIEHVQPKHPDWSESPIPLRELNWDNFLLACTNCNSTKGKKDVEVSDYFWPDRDNTFRVIRYSEGGRVEPALGLTPEERRKAENTIALTGLDKQPNTQKASDRRWNNRRECWDMANRAKKRLQGSDVSAFREQIVETASAKGFWSVWMTVFEDDSDMKKRLIDALPGTAKECFCGDDFHPAQRPGGQM